MGIDIGENRSGFALLDCESRRIFDSGTMENPELLEELGDDDLPPLVVFEDLAPRGQLIDRATMRTLFWLGRMYDRAAVRARRYGMAPPALLLRVDVAMHFTGQRAPKGSLIDGEVRVRFHPSGDVHRCKGTKEEPGPCFGVTGHAWPAVAVAVAHAERLRILPHPPWGNPSALAGAVRSSSDVPMVSKV